MSGVSLTSRESEILGILKVIQNLFQERKTYSLKSIAHLGEQVDLPTADRTKTFLGLQSEIVLTVFHFRMTSDFIDSAKFVSWVSLRR